MLLSIDLCVGELVVHSDAGAFFLASLISPGVRSISAGQSGAALISLWDRVSWQSNTVFKSASFEVFFTHPCNMHRGLFSLCKHHCFYLLSDNSYYVEESLRLRTSFEVAKSLRAGIEACFLDFLSRADLNRSVFLPGRFMFRFLNSFLSGHSA